jgi:hypothetical protein
MSVFIIFVCFGLLAYWASRLMLLSGGSQLEIEQTLARDLRWGRRVLGLRANVSAE